jgi:hypothetical protein
MSKLVPDHGTPGTFAIHYSEMVAPVGKGAIRHYQEGSTEDRNEMRLRNSSRQESRALPELLSDEAGLSDDSQDGCAFVGRGILGTRQE